MLPNLGFGEIILILAVVLLLFGAKRLPDLARSLGKSLNAFKGGLKDVSDEVQDIKSETKKLPDDKE
ncbi:twin-arginine translocase TatA/TatE family subunit [Elusimicrobiota bacterium]